MLLEGLGLLSLLAPMQTGDEKYALLFEQVKRKGWSVVRCAIRRPQTLYLLSDVYRVSIGKEEYLISIDDGNTHLYRLLRDNLTETAKALLCEAQIK